MKMLIIGIIMCSIGAIVNYIAYKVTGDDTALLVSILSAGMVGIQIYVANFERDRK